MKFFIAIAVIALVAGASAFTAEQRTKGEAHLKACLSEIGTDPEAVKKLRSGDFSNSDEKVQCFAKCWFQKADFMDAEGNLKEDVILKKLSVDVDEAKIKPLIEKCKTVTGANPCEKAYKAFECYGIHKAT